MFSSFLPIDASPDFFCSGFSLAACLCRPRSICLETIPSCPPDAFRVVFLHFEALSYHFGSNWLNLSRKYSPILPLEFVHILPSAVTSAINTSDPLQTASMCHNTASTAFDRWRGVLRMLSCSSLSFCTALKIKWSTSLVAFRSPSWSGGTWNHHGKMMRFMATP